MIRRKTLKILAFLSIAAGIGAMPVLVQADIFLKPNDSKREKVEEKESTNKRSWMSYVVNPFKKTAQKRKVDQGVTYYRGRSNGASKVTRHHALYEAPPVDPELLSMAGREPETAEELMAVAAAHKESKINAMNYMSGINAQLAAAKLDQQRRRVDLAKARREIATRGRSLASADSKTTTRRVTGSSLQDVAPSASRTYSSEQGSVTSNAVATPTQPQVKERRKRRLYITPVPPSGQQKTNVFTDY